MRFVAVEHRHRAHDSIPALVAIAALLAGCAGGTVPSPKYAEVRVTDYVPVPFAPRPPPVELVPPRPSAPRALVWADGGWEWSGDRFQWAPGGWLEPPAGAKLARWAIVRRAEDGQLFFAPSRWRDASGQSIEAPTPLVRASPRGGAGGVPGPDP